jgi:hypothetical protein
VYKQELGVWSQIATLASNASSYMATGLVNGRSYDFKISATNANGMSDYSEVVSAVPSTSPSAVRNVHIVGNASELQIIWDQPLSSGGLSYLYSLEMTDGNGGVAYQASALNTRYVEVQNLNTNVQYIVSIYAYNTVDTNYIIYSTQATTVPTPIEITSLKWDNTHATQSIMKWNYASDISAAIDFLLVIMDVTTGVFSSVFVPAHNAIQGEIIVHNNDGSYSYTFGVNHLNAETLTLGDNHTLKVMIFARNADGISPMSNIAQVR